MQAWHAHSPHGTDVHGRLMCSQAVEGQWSSHRVDIYDWTSRGPLLSITVIMVVQWFAMRRCKVQFTAKKTSKIMYVTDHNFGPTEYFLTIKTDLKTFHCPPLIDVTNKRSNSNEKSRFVPYAPLVKHHSVSFAILYTSQHARICYANAPQ